MRVEWSVAARDALARVCGELREWSADAADRLANEATRVSERLAAFPDSGRMAPEFQAEPLREVTGRYRLVYDRFTDRVEIVAFHPSAIPFDESV